MSLSPGNSVVKRATDFVAVRGVFRSSGRQLLATLVILFVSFPFLDSRAWGSAAFSWLFTLVLLSALLAVGGRRRVLTGGLLLLAPALILHWLPHLIPLRTDHPVSLASYCLFVGFVIVQLLRYVLRTPRVDAEVLSAGVSIYLLLAGSGRFSSSFVPKIGLERSESRSRPTIRSLRCSTSVSRP